MAECQVEFSYTEDAVRSLVKQLSDKRYGTYLKKSGHDDEIAFQLYLYNARLAKSFLFPLHVVEIVLRNGVDEVLTGRFGPQWHEEEAFLRILTAESSASLRINRFRNRIAHHEPILSENATQRLREMIDAVAGRSQVAAEWLRNHATVHQVIRTRPGTGSGEDRPRRQNS